MSAVDYIDFSDEREDETPDSYCLEVIKIISESEKAWKILVKLEDDKTHEFWLPKSQCELSDAKDFIVVPDWLFENKIKEIS